MSLKKLILVIATLFCVSLSFGGVDFDGSNDMQTCGKGLLNMGFGVSELTLAAWVYPQTDSANMLIIAKSSSTTEALPFYLALVDNGGSLNAEVKVKTSVAVYIASTSCTGGTDCVEENVWTHIAGVLTSGNRLNLYLNGVFQKQTTTSGIVTTDASNLITIGRFNSGSWPFNGVITDVGIYSVAATQPLLTSLSDGRSRNKFTNNREMYVPMDDHPDGTILTSISAQTLLDRTGNGNNCTPVSGPAGGGTLRAEDYINRF